MKSQTSQSISTVLKKAMGVVILWQGLMLVVLLGVMFASPLEYDPIIITAYVTIFLASLVGAAVFAIYITSAVTRPIVSIAELVKNFDRSKNITAQKTGVSEIDEMSAVIAGLSSDLAKASWRMSKAVELMEIPMAVFNISKDSDKVFVTKSVFQLLRVNPTSIVNGYMKRDEWDRIYTTFADPKNFSYEGSYHINRDADNEKWIKLKTFEGESETLGVLLDVTEEVQARRHLEYERDYDSLTGIMNKRAFFSVADTMLSEVEVTTAAVVMWDLNNLKQVNDRFGHSVGDRYIQEAANIFSAIQDPATTISARISGDEFVLFMFGKKSKAAYRAEISALSDRIAQVCLTTARGEKIRLCASAGAAFYPEDGDNCKTLVKRADFAMYGAKVMEKGSLAEFNPKIAMEFEDGSDIIVERLKD